MVFQNYALFPHMRVAQNLAFPLRMRRLPLAAIRERVTAALALVQLEGLGGRYPRQFSGGQQQRVHHYYYCSGHDLLRARRRVGRCPKRNLRSDELDELVWNEVRRHLESPALIMQAYTTLRAEPAPRVDEVVAEEVRELQKKLAELEREEHRLLDAYQAGLIEVDQLERRQRLLRQRRGHVQASLEAARGEQATALHRADLQMSIQSFARSIRTPLAALMFEDR